MAKKDEFGLTPNRRAFADEYINNKGNATQAYLFAYPHIKNENTAKSNGARLLTNANIANYIANRTKELLDNAKMGQDEIIKTLTSIARREIQESYFKSYDHLTGNVTKEVTNEFQPSIEVSIRALDVLVKFLGSPKENEKIDMQIRKMETEISAISSIEDKESKIGKLLDLVEGGLDG